MLRRCFFSLTVLVGRPMESNLRQFWRRKTLHFVFLMLTKCGKKFKLRFRLFCDAAWKKKKKGDFSLFLTLPLLFFAPLYLFIYLQYEKEIVSVICRGFQSPINLKEKRTCVVKTFLSQHIFLRSSTVTISKEQMCVCVWRKLWWLLSIIEKLKNGPSPKIIMLKKQQQQHFQAVLLTLKNLKQGFRRTLPVWVCIHFLRRNLLSDVYRVLSLNN